VILVAIIVAVALLPFFAFVELGRLMDPGKLTRIFIIRGPQGSARSR
jgi:hypothetical protein